MDLERDDKDEEDYEETNGSDKEYKYLSKIVSFYLNRNKLMKKW